MTGNLVLLATVVATVAVLLAGFAGWRTARSNAEAQYRERLVRQAAVLSVAPNLSVLLLDQAQRLTGATGVQVAVIAPDGQVAGPSAAAVTPADRDALLAGGDVSTTAVLGDARVLVEGRPARDGAVVLTQPFTEVDDAADRIRAGLTLPLIAGLVGAALAGTLLARRICSPPASAACTARSTVPPRPARSPSPSTPSAPPSNTARADSARSSPPSPTRSARRSPRCAATPRPWPTA
ncbi:hypothetical protein [Streptomyces sp. NRRL S-495]|uniref:hypothetical protein n=1 Tax=Streptomyces sp. NRRL S-495 TaxID=1609133 RepID=UPI0025703249|nr:hypothetical protein [Streptomyces sp. NRRL S-495]